MDDNKKRLRRRMDLLVKAGEMLSKQIINDQRELHSERKIIDDLRAERDELKSILGLLRLHRNTEPDQPIDSDLLSQEHFALDSEHPPTTERVICPQCGGTGDGENFAINVGCRKCSDTGFVTRLTTETEGE